MKTAIGARKKHSRENWQQLTNGFLSSSLFGFHGFSMASTLFSASFSVLFFCRVENTHECTTSAGSGCARQRS